MIRESFPRLTPKLPWPTVPVSVPRAVPLPIRRFSVTPFNSGADTAMPPRATKADAGPRELADAGKGLDAAHATFAQALSRLKFQLHFQQLNLWIVKEAAAAGSLSASSFVALRNLVLAHIELARDVTGVERYAPISALEMDVNSVGQREFKLPRQSFKQAHCDMDKEPLFKAYVSAVEGLGRWGPEFAATAMCAGSDDGRSDGLVTHAFNFLFTGTTTLKSVNPPWGELAYPGASVTRVRLDIAGPADADGMAAAMETFGDAQMALLEAVLRDREPQPARPTGHPLESMPQAPIVFVPGRRFSHSCVQPGRAASILPLPPKQATASREPALAGRARDAGVAGFESSMAQLRARLTCQDSTFSRLKLNALSDRMKPAEFAALRALSLAHIDLTMRARGGIPDAIVFAAEMAFNTIARDQFNLSPQLMKTARTNLAQEPLFQAYEEAVTGLRRWGEPVVSTALGAAASPEGVADGFLANVFEVLHILDGTGNVKGDLEAWFAFSSVDKLPEVRQGIAGPAHADGMGAAMEVFGKAQMAIVGAMLGF